MWWRYVAESALGELIREHENKAHVSAIVATLVKDKVIPKDRSEYVIECVLRLCERLKTADWARKRSAGLRPENAMLDKIASQADVLQALVDKARADFPTGILGDVIFDKEKRHAADIAAQARQWRLPSHFVPRKISRKALHHWVLIWDLADLFHALGNHPGTAWDGVGDKGAIPSEFTRFVAAWLKVLHPTAKPPSRSTYQRVLKEWWHARPYAQQRPHRGRRVGIRKAT